MEQRICVSNKFSDAAASPGTTPGKQQLQSPPHVGEVAGEGGCLSTGAPTLLPGTPGNVSRLAGEGGGQGAALPLPSASPPPVLS